MELHTVLRMDKHSINTMDSYVEMFLDFFFSPHFKLAHEKINCVKCKDCEALYCVGTSVLISRKSD